MIDDPIYNFTNLKRYLTNKGYHIGKAVTWRKIDSEEVSLREGTIDFTDEGIFLIDDDGLRRQIFLYKRKYHIEQYGLPRFHICKCPTIEEFMNGSDIPQYRRANTRTVKVINWDDNNREVEVSDLPLCKYCASIIFRDMNYELNSSTFSDMLQESSEEEELKDQEINPRTGYTKDWQEISSAYREKHNYTCEKCGIQVSPLESEYMHVHHKNKNKADNRESNLQCLCIKCHSEVDTLHIHNFSSPSKRLLLNFFLDKYGKTKIFND